VATKKGITTKFFHPPLLFCFWIWDSGWVKSGSGIRDKHPGSATLYFTYFRHIFLVKIVLFMTSKSDRDPDPHWFASQLWIWILSESNKDPQHWFKQCNLLIHTRFLRFKPNRNIFSFPRKKRGLCPVRELTSPFKHRTGYGAVQRGAEWCGGVRYSMVPVR
jgi:hypothetical protein